jgi:hypothetical protein
MTQKQPWALPRYVAEEKTGLNGFSEDPLPTNPDGSCPTGYGPLFLPTGGSDANGFPEFENQCVSVGDMNKPKVSVENNYTDPCSSSDPNTMQIPIETVDGIEMQCVKNSEAASVGTVPGMGPNGVRNVCESGKYYLLVPSTDGLSLVGRCITMAAPPSIPSTPGKSTADSLFDWTVGSVKKVEAGVDSTVNFIADVHSKADAACKKFPAECEAIKKAADYGLEQLGLSGSVGKLADGSGLPPSSVPKRILTLSPKILNKLKNRDAILNQTRSNLTAMVNAKLPIRTKAGFSKECSAQGGIASFATNKWACNPTKAIKKVETKSNLPIIVGAAALALFVVASR